MDKQAADWFEGHIGKTYRDSRPFWRPPPRPKPGAPNIVVVILDDVGFADLGCYGSEIETPAMDALAGGGLRYNNFHVTAMCSVTRASLLTGRNAHAVGVGIIAEWSSGYPGYEGRMSRQAATIPEILGDHGYACHALGKWHLINMVDYGAAGPHGDWPLGRGFDTWYGFHGALTDQWNPELYRDNHPIDHEPGADYHLSEDLVDHAIAGIRDHVTSAPDRPFFLYLAFGACHWPHHVPRAFIEKYDGVYEAGWDEIRARRFARQKELGLIPPNTDLAPRNPDVEAWSDVSPDVRRLAVRLQQTYAGFLDHTDAQLARLVAYLQKLGLGDDTMIVVLSDNGASPEGGATGALNLRKHMVYEVEAPEVGLANLDKIGSAFAFNHYPTGWAQVSNTPLKWYKKDTHGGGIRSPLIVNWPGGIAHAGEIRPQYHHVCDVAPTLYDVLDIVPPEAFRGEPQMDVHGISMAYSFDAPDAPTRRSVQHYEILGDRAIWKDGLKAVVRHVKDEDFDRDRWELYDTDDDFSEVHDLADERPRDLEALKALWWEEAERYGVLPLDDREWERAAAFMKMNPRTRYVFLQDMARIDRLMAPDITGRNFAITVEFEAASRRDEGALLAWGSRFGGLSLHLAEGHVVADYLYSESESYRLAAPLPEGPLADIVLSFHRATDMSGTATLRVNGSELASREFPKTWPAYGVTAGLTCGRDAGCPVSDSPAGRSRFSGRINRVVVDLDGGAPNPEGVLRTLLREE